MTTENYSILLVNAISSHIGYDEHDISVKNMTDQKMVKDATLKYLVLDKLGNKIAFILMSNDDFPDAVKLAVQAAQKARQIVGDTLAGLVVVPSYVGHIGEKSFAVFPCLIPLRSGRFARFIARKNMVHKVLNWLELVSKKTTRQIANEGLQNLVAAPLLWISTCSLIPKDIQSDSLMALKAMESGRWNPKCVFSHNDLWSGNVLIEPSLGGSIAPYGIGEPRIIDWLSSSEDGIPGYDLINYANSSGYALTKVSGYLNRINDQTDQGYESGYFDLLAGLGRLGMNRGEFPLDRYSLLLKSITASYKMLQGI